MEQFSKIDITSGIHIHTRTQTHEHVQMHVKYTFKNMIWYVVFENYFKYMRLEIFYEHICLRS